MSDQARNKREGREVSHALARKLEKNVRILPKYTLVVAIYSLNL